MRQPTFSMHKVWRSSGSYARCAYCGMFVTYVSDIGVEGKGHVVLTWKRVVKSAMYCGWEAVNDLRARSRVILRPRWVWGSFCIVSLHVNSNSFSTKSRRGLPGEAAAKASSTNVLSRRKSPFYQDEKLEGRNFRKSTNSSISRYLKGLTTDQSIRA